MFRQCLFVCCLLAVSQVNAMMTTKDQKMEQLANDLTTSHTSFVSPGTGITLNTKLYMQCVDKDVFNPEMATIRILEKFMWTDNRLTWNPNEYDGITKIYLPVNKIWTPDMVLYDSNHEMVIRDNVNVMITNNGMVTWMPTTTYKVRCGTHKPFTSTTTTNMCKVTMGSATMDETMLKMNKDGTGIDMMLYGNNCPVKMTNPEVKVESSTSTCCEGTYSVMKMTFNLHMNTDM